MPDRSAACSTVGLTTPSASKARAAATSAARVRPFWCVLPVCSYGIDMRIMVLYCPSLSHVKGGAMAAPRVRNAQEGEHLWFAGGGVFTLKLSAEETGGAFFLLEDHVVRGKTTPLHRHRDEDELIYVLDGELIAHIGGVEHRVRKGGLAYFPRGV